MTAAHQPEWECRCGRPHCATDGEIFPCTNVDNHARRHYTHTQWFNRTGHCGACGSPGEYCFCRPANPCGCQHLHPIGSAYTPDALNTFAQADDQAELW